jgi:hypothetical protein
LFVHFNDSQVFIISLSSAITAIYPSMTEESLLTNLKGLMTQVFFLPL